jgi:hypothetical protein
VAPYVESPTIGANAADNSGVLSYIRIEFAGYRFQLNNETNGLTMGGVGSGTQIDHIQVSYSNDDAFEWFGGTVNCAYLVTYGTTDDEFDTDFGYTGKVQFGFGLRIGLGSTGESAVSVGKLLFVTSTDVPYTTPLLELTLVGRADECGRGYLAWIVSVRHCSSSFNQCNISSLCDGLPWGSRSATRPQGFCTR